MYFKAKLNNTLLSSYAIQYSDFRMLSSSNMTLLNQDLSINFIILRREWLRILYPLIYSAYPLNPCMQHYNSSLLFNKICSRCVSQSFLFSFFLLLLLSIYVRRKCWVRENFRHPVFDEFAGFEMYWPSLENVYLYVCMSPKFLWTLYLKN